MAILIQEEKRKINWVFVVGAFIVIVSIGAALYYLFFVNPSRIEGIISPALKPFSDLNQVNFSPEQLINNSKFKALSPQVEFQSALPESVGKANPFLP